MTRPQLLNSLPDDVEGRFQQTASKRLSQFRHRSVWFAYLFAAGVFALDCFLNVSGTIAMLYAVAAALAIGSGRQKSLTQVGLMTVVLTVLGYFVGLSGTTRDHELIERTCAVLAIGLMCWVGQELLRSAAAADRLRIDGSFRQVAEEAANFFQTIVNHIPVGISRTDRDGRLIFVNDAFCRMWNFTEDALLGRMTSDVLPETLATKSREDENTVAHTERSLESLDSVLSGDNERFLKIIRTPIKDANESFIGIQTAWMDVTELKNAEGELARYAENLERSNVDLQQFAYVASHDLQEPLRAVGSYCQLLEKHYSDSLDTRGLRWMQFVVGGAHRMQALVRDLLIFARIDNRSTEWSKVRSRTACMRAVEVLQPTLKAAGATIIVGNLPKVMADETQLQMLFQNLIGNAVKFRRDVAPEVYISAKRIKEGWRFSIKDNGIGIKPEFLDRVFVIFKRLHSHDQYPGTGIGLAICKRIVERYGGRIWVQSQFGVGSAFYFVLPVRRSKRPETLISLDRIPLSDSGIFRRETPVNLDVVQLP